MTAIVETVPVTLEELMSVAANNEEDDAILDNLKTLAAETLPEGWQNLKSLNLSAAEALGLDPEAESVDPQVLNKLRYALPTVGIAKAFNPEASSLSEKVFREYKIKMINWDFCRALITSPPAVVNRLRGSRAQTEIFAGFLKPLKNLLVSRVEADQALRQAAGGTIVEEESEDEPQSKRARLEALENRMDMMFKILCEKKERKCVDAASDKENSFSASASEDSSEEEGSWTAPDMGWSEQPHLSESGDGDLVLIPQVKVCEPPIPEPDSKIKADGLACQKLGTAAWNQIKYKEVQKKLQAAPVFDALKINNQLGALAPKSFAQTLLAKSDSSAGTLTHGLLIQRERLSLAAKSLVEKYPQIREDVRKAFFGESPFATISDEILHFTCAKRAEIIEWRRNAFKARDPHHTAKLMEIPPSESHLFDEMLLSEFLNHHGGVRKIFFQDKKKSFQPAQFGSFRPKLQSNSRTFSQPQSSRKTSASSSSSKQGNKSSGKTPKKDYSKRGERSHRKA
ncbi:uncharacterized protein [Fopius arisanus]|nr:PREDICTED: uncharacterized protein LOC105270231 isoform X2 [Fopius arisanus]